MKTKLNHDVLAWVESHERLIRELMTAESIVKFGRIVLRYQNGKYHEMDLHPTMKIVEVDIDKIE